MIEKKYLYYQKKKKKKDKKYFIYPYYLRPKIKCSYFFTGYHCSSLAFEAMQELGPFRVHSDGKTLYRNILSWNYDIIL